MSDDEIRYIINYGGMSVRLRRHPHKDGISTLVDFLLSVSPPAQIESVFNCTTQQYIPFETLGKFVVGADLMDGGGQ